MNHVYVVHELHRSDGDAVCAVCGTEAAAEQWVRTQVALLMATHHVDIDRSGDGAHMLAYTYYHRYRITEMPVLRHGTAGRCQGKVTLDDTFPRAERG